MIDEALVARARTQAARVAPLADAIEAVRGMPPEAVDALVQAGVFKLFVPRAYGGAETTPSTAIAIIEAFATADGSAGWCAMIGVTSSIMSLYLDDETAREVYGPPDAVTCGVFAPMGRATKVDGGLRVSGRWSFASGCEHSAYRMGGAMLAGEGDAPPSLVSVLFRADETRIIDTWNTSGLRGTGSHDFEVKDVIVPRSRTFSLLTDRPKQKQAAATGAQVLPFFGVLAAGVGAVGLGIARAAVDTFVAVAKGKATPGGKRTQAHRETIQLEVARAEGRLRAARAFLYEAAADVEAEGARGEISLGARARLRIAASHAAEESAAIVTAMYRAGGGSAVYATSPLQRHLRDAQVVPQHIMVASAATTTAGRVLLDLETDTTTL